MRAATAAHPRRGCYVLHICLAVRARCFHNIDLGVTDTNPLAMPLGEVRSVQKVSDKYKGHAVTALCKGMNAHAELSAGAEATEPRTAKSFARGARSISCMENHEWNIQGRMRMTPPPAAMA